MINKTNKITAHNALYTSLVVAVFTVLPTSSLHADESEDIKMATSYIRLIDSFLTVVDKLHHISSDPEKSAIYHLHELKELHKGDSNEEDTVEILEKF